MNKPYILIVDDLYNNRLLLENVLKPVDAETISAESGAQALELLPLHDYALLILDVNMPGMNGFELAQHVRDNALYRHIPIVFITARFIDEASVSEGYKAGAVDYITKPYNIHVLLSKVRIFLELHQQKKELKAEVAYHLKTKQALAQSETALNNAQQLAQLGSWEYDIPKQTYHCSNGIFQLMGTNGDIFQYDFLVSLSDCLVREDHTQVMEIFSDPTQNIPTLFEFRIILPNGKTRYIHSRINKSQSPDGKPMISGTLQDITNTKLTERQLFNAHEEINQIFKIAPPLCAIRKDYTISRANDTFLSSFELNQSVIGEKCYDILKLPHCQTSNCPMHRLMQGVDAYDEIIDTQLDNGRKVSYFLTAAPNKNKEGELESIVCSFQDITELRKMDEEIKGVNQQLEKRIKEEFSIRQIQQKALAQKSKLESLGHISANVAHEIKQPLGLISMALDNIMFKQANHKISEDYLHSKFEHLFENIEKIKHIIDHIKIFSRKESQLKLQQVEVGHTVRKALSLISRELSTQQIILHEDFAQECYILGNKTNLEQVIVNLITNAKHAVLERAALHPDQKYQKHIWVTIRKENDQIVLVVKDNGTGIPQEVMKQMFEPFYTTKEPEKGTGLGLSIVAGILEEMKSSIDVESEENEYTRMIINMPEYKDSGPLKTAPKKKPQTV